MPDSIETYEETPEGDAVLAHAGRSRDRASWHGAAFVLESMLLVVFLAVSLAVLAAVFAGAQRSGLDAIRLTDAVTLAASGAANGAEDFASDPVGAYEEGTTVTRYTVAGGTISEADDSDADACEVTRTVEVRPADAGDIYDARITVTREGEVLYELDTSAYVSGRQNSSAVQAEGGDDDGA